MSITTVTERVPESAADRLVGAASNVAVLGARNILVWIRMPGFIVGTLTQPVIFILLFCCVLVRPMSSLVAGSYIDFLLPGVVVQAVSFSSIATAVALARGMRRGVADRFRSMPIARLSYLGGRLAADVVRMAVTVVVMLLIGYVAGFRYHGSLATLLLFVVSAVAWGTTMCVVAAFIGLAVRQEETVQTFGFLWLFPLTFLSSAFVPVETLPGALRGFGQWQPITTVVDGMRAMSSGRLDWGLTLSGFAWSGVLLVAFGVLVTWLYDRLE